MEEIATNIDILKTIFQYLNIQQQIKLSKVCTEFQYVIVNCMWRYKYRQIKVYKLNGDSNIIETNSNRDNESNLLKQHFVNVTNEELQNFLKLNQENIIELEISDYRSDDLEEYKYKIINNEWNFINLEKLYLLYINIDVKQMEMIYENCKNLKVLQLKQCCNFKADLLTLSEQNNYEYEILLKIIKTLKEFYMDYREMQFSDCTLNLHDLLYNNNLKHLNLNVPLKNLRYKETPRLKENSCEILHLGNFNEYKTLQKFSRLYLKTFENLFELTLEGSLNKIFLDSQFIDNLALACVRLKKLNLKRCLMNIDNFNLLTTLTDIQLNNCMSLTWRNLKQLLELPLLQTFHSIYSNYTREFEEISIPFQLHSLTLVGNDFRFAQIFDNSKEQLTNLKELKYFDGSDNTISQISLKFPSLQTLHIMPHHVVIKDLLNLRNLLSFKVPKYQKTSDNILQLMYLLNHPSLRELSLTVGCNLEYECSIDLSNISKTNLYRLELDFEVFNFLSEYLLDLLKFNLKLNIIVTSDEVADFQYYCMLVKNRKFCRDFIKLCGFQIGKYEIFIILKYILRHKCMMIKFIN